MVYRASTTGPVGLVLAGPIFVRKRGRDKLCTNAIMCVHELEHAQTSMYAYTLIECSRWIME